jgi:uncharacterized protein
MTTETDSSECPNDQKPARSARSGLTRRILLGALGLSGLAGSGTAAYATSIEPNSLVVTSYRPRLPRWPAGRPLSVSVIADLHAGGPNMAVPHIRRVVDVANDLKSDVTVLLGDYIATHPFVTERVPLNVWARELGRLHAPLGVWAVMGNHDWWYGITKVRRALADAGIPVLENRAVRLGQNGSSFWLAGLGDQLAHRVGRGRFKGVDDLRGTLARVDTDDPVILLAHEPEIFPTVPDRVALTLAGHTHGGQVRVPLVSEKLIPSYRTRFAYGHITERRRHMIVSGGLGTSIVPVRLGVPPEIVRIDLGA